MKKTATLSMSDRIDRYLETVPRSKPWFDCKSGVWRKGRAYITKSAIMSLLLEHRRARALQAMVELDAEIAREGAAEQRRLARKRGTRASVKSKAK